MLELAFFHYSLSYQKNNNQPNVDFVIVTNTFGYWLLKTNPFGETGVLGPKSSIFSRFQVNIWIDCTMGIRYLNHYRWSRLGLIASPVAAPYVVIHPQPSHNLNDTIFLLDPLSKSEFLFYIAFGWIMSVGSLIPGQWIVKLALAVSDAPFIYRVVWSIRRRMEK